jgi:hypothetical protein
VFGAPIPIPASAGRTELETYRLLVQEAMNDTTRLAEEWAAREKW